MGAMNSLGGYSSFNSGFGSGDTNTPSLLDLSEFPSLTNRNAGDNVPQPSPMPGAKPYVGMVKQPTSEASEFTMSSEDFPALPGTQNRDGASPGSGTSADKSSSGTGGEGNGSVRENEKSGSKTGGREVRCYWGGVKATFFRQESRRHLMGELQIYRRVW